MKLRKVHPCLEYVEQNNEIFVRIFEGHVKLLVDNQHGQVQSNIIKNQQFRNQFNKLHSIRFQRMISYEVTTIPDQSTIIHTYISHFIFNCFTF
jgi:hypothetical protein